MKKIHCNNSREIPSLEIIEEELTRNESIRIDYDSRFNFIFIRNLKRRISTIEKSLNVEIHKGKFKGSKCYILYNLLSDIELEKISVQLEEATKSYRLTSEYLIQKFEEKYDYSFTNSNKSYREIEDKIDKDKNQLSENWTYRFHGGDVCFSNSQSGQIVDINLKFDGVYGVLDLWFFQYYMKTTNKFKSLSLIYIDNTPKLIQTLNYLKKNGKLKLVKSKFDFLYSEKLVWDRITNIIPTY